MEMNDNKEHNSEDEYYGPQSFNLNSIIKHEHELFKEEENVKYQMINVRRVNLPRKKIEDWEILVDGHVFLILKGTRFSTKEKEYLRTLNGIKFVIAGYKQGWKSVSKFKTEIKKHVRD